VPNTPSNAIEAESEENGIGLPSMPRAHFKVPGVIFDPGVEETGHKEVFQHDMDRSERSIAVGGGEPKKRTDFSVFKDQNELDPSIYNMSITDKGEPNA
jgi:hypothetical protein